MSPVPPFYGVPEDLAEFWAEAVAEAEGAWLDYSLHAQEEITRPHHHVEVLKFRGMGGHTKHGWVASPQRRGQWPCFLWLAPYSRWSMLPNEYGTREGFTSLSFNFFGESAFHQEVYHPSRGYFAEGAGEPKTWIFRRMLQDAVIASRVLEDLASADRSKMASMGMSQGGGLSIWLAAVTRRIKAVCADMPFLADMGRVLTEDRIFRYPIKELTDYMGSFPLGTETVLHTISYFDTAHMATLCKVPTLVTAGLKDPAVRPSQVQAVFDGLAGPKEMVELDWGHDWHPSMVGRNREFLLENL